MSGSLGSDPPAHSEGEIPQDKDWQHLFQGLEKGFNSLENEFKQIMVNLSRVEDELTNIPGKTVDALEVQRSIKDAEQGAIGNFAADPNPYTAPNELVAKNQQLETENTRLQGLISSAHDEIERRTKSETELKDELAHRGREVSRLQQEKAQFRDIILSNAGTQKVTDQEVIQTFSDLRQSVQQLASSKIFTITSPPILPAQEVYRPKMRHFYNQCRNLRGKDVVNRAKAQIFSLLHYYILERTCFGLKRENKEGRSNNDLWNMEEDLSSFEDYLSKNPAVNEGMIADWRICTLDCIKLLGLKEEYSRYVAEILENFFAPLIPKHATSKEQSELWEKILEICRKSIGLQSMLQRSKEGYSVVNLENNKRPLFSSVSYLAEVMDVENGKASDASDEISYFLFGALTKHNKQLGGEPKTLVKAEVVVKRKIGR